MKRPPNSEGTQFKPGQSGNPKGRPKKLPDLERLLTEVLGDEDDKDSNAMRILNALAERALKKGGDRAAEILLDRGWGKAKQSIDLHHDGDPITTVIYEPAGGPAKSKG